MQKTKEDAKFRRITGYSREVCEFLKSYYLEASRSGVVIEGELQNPTPQQLSYYNENMGSRFEMSVGFIVESLRKWLPRINSEPRTAMATAIYDVLSGLRANGKTESVLKNAYIIALNELPINWVTITHQRFFVRQAPEHTQPHCCRY